MYSFLDRLGMTYNESCADDHAKFDIHNTNYNFIQDSSDENRLSPVQFSMREYQSLVIDSVVESRMTNDSSRMFTFKHVDAYKLVMYLS